MIRERNGNTFKARFEDPGNVREIQGTIELGRINWLAKNVRVITRGVRGHDHSGILKGEEIELNYAGMEDGSSGWKAVTGTLLLYLEK
jgi:hypothetical protein